MVDFPIPQERCDFYVYVIFRPNGTPCYVGKGCGHRDRVHEVKGSHNAHLNSIIRLGGGSLPTIRFRSDLTADESFDLEKLLIRVIGRETCGGPLVNQSDGGEGPNGVVRSAGYREKQRKSQTGKSIPYRQRLNQCISHLQRKGRTLENLGEPGFKLTSFQRKLLDKPPLTRQEMGAITRQRSIGNKYGVGNKRTPEGQVISSAAVAKANSLRVPTEAYREIRRAIAKAMWAKRTTKEKSAWSKLAVAGKSK